MTAPKAADASARDQVEATVLERARHDTSDKVGDTRSFANMEQTLTREYWGRFLIELLQNARDAWLRGPGTGRDGLLRVRLTSDAELVVCNEGEPLSPEVVLHSISKFGESPKKYGEGIGHKGIGFKAVLELTHAPRLYSRTDPGGSFDLQIRFDPEEARRLVRECSPDWDRLVAELPSAAVGDKRGDRIPILRFPLWDSEPPSWLDGVARIDGRPFNTVICLPYDARFDRVLELSREDFVARVRRAFTDISDEVVLLLGVFGRIVVEDEIDGSADEIVRSQRKIPCAIPDLQLHEVTVERNGQKSSRWWLFERSLSGFTGLEGDLAVAVRLVEDEKGGLAPTTPQDATRDGSSADCFHLFFPTKIRTHLPFLFHAYFEVDAGRKSFAEDRSEENGLRLAGLRSLAVDVTRHLVQAARQGKVDLLALPSLFAATDGEPDDVLAREFRAGLLGDLDLEPWVQTGGRTFSSPGDLLIDNRGELPQLLPVAFPPSYVRARVGLEYPKTRDPRSLAFLTQRNSASRKAEGEGLDGGTLRELMHPGTVSLWDEDPDGGFRALLEVLDVTKRDPDIAALLDELRTDANATVIPVVDESGSRRLRAPGQRQTDPEVEGGDALGAILARVSASGDVPLTPPRSLGLDFVSDGLLDAERLAGLGAKLGIRPYQTEVIVDALAARPDEPENAREILRFVWRLLLGERGRYSLVNVLRSATVFEPGRWFWSKADGNRLDADREELRRARALANLLIPAADGSWRPATALAFGSEWADWLDLGADRLGSAATLRAAAYRDLEAIAPGRDSLIAGPEILATELPLLDEDIGWAQSETAPELPADAIERHVFLLHALLLRLGVWEVPPFRGYVNYRYPRPVRIPPWADHPDWLRLRHAHEASDAEFARFGHKNVHVAEDFALAWPLEASETYVRALGRGAATYRAYRRAELFCPTCSSGGHSHSKRYSSDGDGRFRSFLQWQLGHEPWVPTKVWGHSQVATPPGDAWFEDDLPDEARMQQSWLRFLPIATPELNSDLAGLVGVRRLKDADVPRIERLLRALREQFEAGDIDAERRVGSFESQAFMGLHQRLYEQLATRDAAAGRAALEKIGVLAVMGRSLTYRPRSECRQDDGTSSAFRRYFQSQLPFAALTREQGPIADSLGMERFRVKIERLGGGVETTVTGDVRAFVHDRAAAFLALQVFHPIGARALQLDGREFPLRAERLRRLEVVHVDDLVLRLTVDGTDLTKEIGAGRAEDMYLDMDRAPAVLYHDIGGTRWEDRFRQLAGPYLAALLENPAYSATFQLLLQAESDGDVEVFLEEQSISSDDVDLVRSQIEAVSGLIRAEERRWWSVLLALLGADVPTFSDAETFRRDTLARLQSATAASVVPDLAMRLFRAGGGEGSRSDGSREGPLAALETHGVDLQFFHELLVDAGDRGLRVQASADRLAEWRRLHGREVSAILATHGTDVEAAKSLPDAWVCPPRFAFKIDSRPEEYLAAVIADLRMSGLDPDPSRLIGAGASEYLAELAGETGDQLAATWRGLFDEEERSRLQLQRASAWKRALRPVLVAARTGAGDAGQAIRAEAVAVDSSLPAAPGDPTELAHSLAAVLIRNSELAELLSGLLTNDRSLSEPTTAALRGEIGPFLDLGHFDRVVNILQHGRRQLVDQVRQDIEDVKQRLLLPLPFSTAQPPARRPPVAATDKTTVRPRRAHDQRVRDRLGVKGERVALAAVLDALFSLPRDKQDRVIDELVEMLESIANQGGIVDNLVANARAAQSASDEDDRIEALVGFLHVAQVSDDFGFDLLGYLAPFSGTAPRPLFLEVKNSASRRFIASAPEWRRAEQQRDRYSFLVVLRDPKSENPLALELVPDPSELFRRGQISLEEESWSVGYVPDPPPASETPLS
jgi:hypothetical protein